MKTRYSILPKVPEGALSLDDIIHLDGCKKNFILWIVREPKANRKPSKCSLNKTDFYNPKLTENKNGWWLDQSLLIVDDPGIADLDFPVRWAFTNYWLAWACFRQLEALPKATLTP